MTFFEEQLAELKAKLKKAKVSLNEQANNLLQNDFEARFDAIENVKAERTSAKICVKRLASICIDIAEQEAGPGQPFTMTEDLLIEALEATRYAFEPESEFAGTC